MALRNAKVKWKCPAMIKIRKGWLYRILVIGIVVLSSIYLIDYTTTHLDEISHYTKLLQPRSLDYTNEIDEVVDENYFVKTNGCRIVRMDMMNDQIRSFFPTEKTKPSKIECGPPAITDSDEKYLWINLTEPELKKFYNISSSEQLQCYFTSFTRLTDYSVAKNETINLIPFGQRTRVDSSEYIQVFCENSNQSQLYVDFHSFFPKRQEERPADDKYSVMILGLDSLSRLNFHRMMNASATTVLDELGAIEMQGYNKVGDNTYPNLIPLLSGLSADELHGACQSSNASMYFDNCHFIWDDFKQKGYGTLFSEDSAVLSLFNYFKNGFEKQPVDYYFRTVLHQMEKDIAYNKIGNYKLCLGSQRPIDVLFKYLRKFVKSTADQLFFSFFWTSSMTHDFINHPMLIDKDLSELLLQMKKEKRLEKTILFLLSDHGLRFGSFRQTTFQGMVEERLRKIHFRKKKIQLSFYDANQTLFPAFLFAVLPETFKKKYPLAVRNLRRNSRRLTTHFDVFETLKDLSNVDKGIISNEKIQKRSADLKEREATLPRGISLFLEIPGERTCDLAGIERFD